MSPMTALFPAFVVLIVGQVWARSRWLFATWSFLYCLLPTFRLKLGPVSVYWCDLAAAAALLYWHTDSARPRAAPALSQWYRILLAALGVGFLSSLVRYGALFEPAYWLVRYGFALAALLLVSAYGRDTRVTRPMLVGAAAAAACMCAVAVVQATRSPLLPQVEWFLYDGYATESASRVRDYHLRLEGPLRVYGTYSTSTQFGGAAAACGILVTLLGRVTRRSTLVAASLAWSAALMTFSRHALLAVVVFLVGTAVLAPRRSKWVWAVGAMAVVLFSMESQTGFEAYWRERIERGGAYDDPNLYARLVEGPGNFIHRVYAEPSVLYGGIGLGSEHILGDVPAGFVSNSFLLYLLYCGVAAFLAFGACFFFAFVGSWRAPRLEVPAEVPAGVLAMGVIVASDNYAYFAPNVVFMWASVIAYAYRGGILPLPAEPEVAVYQATRTRASPIDR